MYTLVVYRNTLFLMFILYLPVLINSLNSSRSFHVVYLGFLM